MKKFIVLIILIVAALLAYSYFTTGKLPLLSSFSPSEESQGLKQLAADFRDACNLYRQAGRTAGLTGLDTTSEADAALREIDRIEGDLKTLKSDMTSEDAMNEAARLEAEIRVFKSGLR